MKIIITCLSALLVHSISSAQLVLGGYNPNSFVAQSLSSANASVSNVNYVGFGGAISYFSANVQNMPFTSGVLMTTGENNSAIGPNNDQKTSVDNYHPGYEPLTNLLGNNTFNAAVLSFDVIPSGNSLKIKYIFASEEYSEYVGYHSTDGMAIYISGPGITGTQNIARLANGTYISVNNVHNGTSNPAPGVTPMNPSNPQFFVNNGNGNQSPYNSSNMYLQFDGLTVPLTAESVVIPGETYHIVIAIADGGDATYDSGVFIEAGGITASLGENDLSESVTIFYNPDNQHATIEVKDLQDQLTCSISDLSGKVLTQSTISGTTAVDMSGYSSGMYLINVTGSNGQVSKKVIR